MHHSSAQHMFQLFDGYRNAYGLYKLDESDVDADGKAKGKGTNINKVLDIDLWHKHLAGELRLGVIPIDQKSMVKWGCIDIDEYTGLQYQDLYDRVNEKNLPLVLCRTKSSGVHCYLFLSDWTKASLVRRKLHEMAAAIGHGNAEVFPKQDKVMYEQGDLGNWVNMPYYHASRTLQYGFNPENVVHSFKIEEFLRYAAEKTISSAQLARIKVHVEHESFPDGPPCLNFLAKEGIPEGMRNDTMFNIAIYAKKVNPDGFQPLVEEYNTKYLNPPLSSKEILDIIKSVDAKDYGYTCNKPPIKTYCDKTKCRGCKFGIGNSSAGLPVMGSLTKYNSSPPIWFVEIEEGGRLKLSTDELQQPYHFQRAAMEQLNKMPMVPKREVWGAVINNLMANLMVIEAPADASPTGVLWEMLEEFCLQRSQVENECLLRGLVWTNKGYHYFRLRDLMDYLLRKKFNELTRNFISHFIKEKGGVAKAINIKGKCVQVLMIEEFKDLAKPIETPDFEVEDDPF